jgi:hypothetical protein
MTTTLAPDRRTPEAAHPETADPGPLRAAHTPNFPALLRRPAHRFW